MRKKVLAVSLLLVWCFEMIFPTISLALTDGPSLPEATGFASVSDTELVDDFTGDFKYNIPLLDVGGYPLTLSYASGIGMEQEASWVGLGWSLNPGSINRQLRGLPDDFKGDKIKKEIKLKNNYTIGVNVNPGMEVFGFNLQGFTGGLFYNSYKGYGMMASAYLSRGFGGMTHSSFTAGMGITLNSQSGVDLNPSVGWSRSQTILGENKYKDRSLSFNLGGVFSSRDGMKDLNFSAEKRVLGQKINQKDKFKDINRVNSGTYSFVSRSYASNGEIPMLSQNYGLNISIGGEFYGTNPHGRVSGFYSSIKPLKQNLEYGAFGYCYEEEKKRDEKVLLDVSREKDGGLGESPQALSVPVHTFDLYNITSEGFSGQFRAYRSDVGVLHDLKDPSGSVSASLGGEFGSGALAHFGANISGMLSMSVSSKWKNLNYLRNAVDFQNNNSNITNEQFYFKMSGEQTSEEDNSYLDDLGGANLVKPELDGSFPLVRVKKSIQETDNISGSTSTHSYSGSVRRSARDVRATQITPITVSEKLLLGKSHHVISYPLNNFLAQEQFLPFSLAPIGFSNRPSHHVAEFEVTKADGGRLNYGLPVYNNLQRDVSFAIVGQSTFPDQGLVSYNPGVDNSKGNTNGIDNYFMAQNTPAYVTSHLLTSAVSTDYVDRLNDGPSNDDVGTWVKFNYSRKNPSYKWRLPLELNKANYQQGYCTNNLDDKASYVYGEKELWQLHSIESNNMLAIFHVSARYDALPVLGENGGIDFNFDNGPVKLDSIELFLKSDIAKNGIDGSLPEKTIHFAYDYDLCKGVPNNYSVYYLNQVPPQNVPSNMQGKLTLKEVWFTNRNSRIGAFSKYTFSYSDCNPDYNPLLVDRWGNYRRENPYCKPSGLTTDELGFFPYANTDATQSNTDASAWALKTIKLPTGGKIEVEYESDDYAFVQNKRACEMLKVIGVGNSPNSTPNEVLFTSKNNQSNYWFIDLQSQVQNKADIKERVIANLKFLFFKAKVNLLKDGKEEFVEGYADIIDYGLVGNSPTNRIWILVGSEGGINPISKSAFQLLKGDLQSVAYQKEPVSGIKEAIIGLLSSALEIKSFIVGYDNNAIDKGWGQEIVDELFWVKLSQPDYKRLGGGSRVKSITLKDDWYDQSGTEDESNYKTVYEYTTEITTGTGPKTISSGVASYEPNLGGEENVFRMPVSLPIRKHLNSPYDNRFTEEPLCESYFPAPVVGYSKVKSYKVDYSTDQSLNNGYLVKEFYTSKDYPTVVKRTSITIKPSPNYSFARVLFNLPIIDIKAASQGYLVILNDMHGKQKMLSTYNSANTLISYNKFIYRNSTLKNGLVIPESESECLYPNNEVRATSLGEDVDLTVDLRDHVTLSVSLGAQGNIDVLPVPPPAFAIAIPNFKPSLFFELVNLKTAVTCKVVNRSGILDYVESYTDGAVFKEQNIYHDPFSGIVLVKAVNDEFKVPNYLVNQPAYWKYDNMGSSYQNTGFKFTFPAKTQTPIYNTPQYAPSDYIIDLKLIDGPGSLPVGYLQDILHNGDELIPATVADESKLYTYLIDKTGVAGSTRFWVANPDVCTSDDPMKMTIIDDLGNAIDQYDIVHNQKGLNEDITFKVIRSGKKNQLGSTMANYKLVCAPNQSLVNQSGQMNLADQDIISMEATEYVDNWKLDTKKRLRLDCQDVYASDWVWLEKFVEGLSTMATTNSVNPLYGSQTTTGSYTIGEILEESGVDPSEIDTCTLIGNSVSNIIFSPTSPGIQWTDFYGAHLGNDCFFTIERIEPAGALFNLNDIKYFDVITSEPNTHNYILSSNSTDPVINYQLKVSLICSECQYECVENENNNKLNPFVEGLINRWYPKRNWKFNEIREQNTRANLSGTYSLGNGSDLPFVYSNNYWNETFNLTNSKWVRGTELLGISKFNNELEERNALNISSSVLFGYQNELAVGRFDNARYEEVYFTSYEDLDYFTGRESDRCYSNRWDLEHYFPGLMSFTQEIAHTGLHSAKIPENGSLEYKSIYRELIPTDDCNYKHFQSHFIWDDALSLMPLINLETNKKYLLDVWVHKEVDCSLKSYGNENTTVGSIEFYNLNGGGTPTTVLTDYFKPKQPEIIIDGWQLYELIVETPNIYEEVKVKFGSEEEMYIDDFRLIPLKAKAKTFVYNPVNTDVMATLDENHYATFYEYNEDGELIRTKKETERGVYTLVEHRKNIKRIP